MSPRIRIRSSIAPGINQELWNYNTPVCNTPMSWSLTSVTQTPVYGSYRVMSDVVTPDFNRRSRNGEFIFNDLQVQEVTVPVYTGSGGHFQEKTKQCVGLAGEGYPASRSDGPRICSGANMPFQLSSSFGGLPVPDVNLLGSDRNSLIGEATTECLAKRGVISDSNLFESAMEINKTFSLLDDILENSSKVLGRKIRAVERAQNLASAYLAYRYGIRPLIMDVNSVLKGLEQRLGKRLIRSRGSVSDTRNLSRTYDVAPNSYTTHTYSKYDTHSIKVRALSLDSVDVTRLQALGLGSKELQTVAWELLPYSFVSDWFANVGDFLQSLAYLDGVNQLGSCTVVEETMSSSVTCLGTKSTYYDVLRPLSGTISSTLHVKTRTASLGSPRIVIKASFGFDRIARVLDSVALITQKVDSLERVIRKLR